VINPVFGLTGIAFFSATSSSCAMREDPMIIIAQYKITFFMVVFIDLRALSANIVPLRYKKSA
jgi:hypothetical protein